MFKDKPITEPFDFMDLESIDIESLTQEDKEDAYNKMQAMMSNMQLLMQKIQPLSKV